MDQFQTFDSTSKPITTTAKKYWWKKTVKIYSWILIVILAFVLGLGIGQINQQTDVENDSLVTKASDQIAELFGKSGVDTGLFKDVWLKIHQDYYGRNNINDSDLFYGALSGMVSALGDPHTLFFDPKITKEFNQELSGIFYGIGAEIGRRDGLLIVIAPLAGTPAEKAGLKPGDKILAIDSKDATEYSVDQAISLIRGEKGTQVTLTILNNADNQTRDVVITREKISVPSVTYKLEDNLAIIKLSSFNEDTAEQFAKIVNKLLMDNPAGIVLDLRNNPGGYLETSVQITSYWLEPGQVIVREEFADLSKNQSHSAITKPSLAKFNTVILVNEGSASASEILAGALKDYDKARIVGKKSYGKGSVQNLFPLSDDTSVKITVAKWLTPKGSTIDGIGIKPDVEVDYTEADFKANIDPQLDKAKELLKQ